MNDIIYFIGNGTRSKWQMEYLKDKTTFACNMAPFEWMTWPFIPDYWSTTEGEDYKNNFLERLSELNKCPKFNDIYKFLPDYIKKETEFPNTRYRPITQYTCQNPYSKHGIIRFGCTGSVCVGICLRQLKFFDVIIIGCDAHRTKVEDCPYPLKGNNQDMYKNVPEAYVKKTNDRHIRGWRRLRKWKDKLFPDSLILNASEESEIDCLPKIKLGKEMDYISKIKELPPVKNPNYWRTH